MTFPAPPGVTLGGFRVFSRALLKDMSLISDLRRLNRILELQLKESLQAYLDLKQQAA